MTPVSVARLYLLASAIGLIPIALSYGIAPAEVLPRLLDISVASRDLTHIFRAIMGLYLAFVAMWLLGAWKPHWMRTAILLEVLFMGGLAAGRALSFVMDGVPSPMLTFYLAAEAVSAVIGVILLRRLPATVS